MLKLNSCVKSFSKQQPLRPTPLEDVTGGQFLPMVAQSCATTDNQSDVILYNFIVSALQWLSMYACLGRTNLKKGIKKGTVFIIACWSISDWFVQFDFNQQDAGCSNHSMSENNYSLLVILKFVGKLGY